MSDQSWLAVIVIAAATLVIFGILILLRQQIKKGKVKIGREGFEGEVETHVPAPPAEPVRPPDAVPPASNRLTVRNVDITGVRNRVSAQGNAEVSDIRLQGEDLSLTAGSEDTQKR